MTPFIYRVLSEARLVAQENPDGPLAAELAKHDAVECDAVKAAHYWSTMATPGAGAASPPSSRAGSLPYVPTRGQAMYSPLLAACHAAGMTETQAIEMLFRETESLRAALLRKAELAPMRFVLSTKPEAP